MQNCRAIVAVLCSIALLFPLPLGIQGVIATIAQFFCGWPLYSNWKKNLLPVIGITGTYLFSFYFVFIHHTRGIYFETSAFLITLLLLSRILENRYQRQAKSRRTALLQPQFAQVKRKGELFKIPAAEICTGDIFIVNPNELIPADGHIEKGESVVDESMLFGGNKAIEKQTGHPIYAGSMNHHGTLIGMATKPGHATFLNHILQSNRPPQPSLQKTATVLFISISLFTWIGWHFTAQGFLNALTVLLIASPRAFSLARSLPIALACNKAFEKGIFIKETKAIEAARKIDRVIIDKKAIISEEALTIEKNTIPQSYYPIVKTLCEHSDHPASKVILDQLKAAPSISSMMVFRTAPGQGVNGYFDERKYFLGSMAYFQQHRIPIDKFQQPYNEETGLLVAFGTEKLSIGYLLLSDQIQPDSAEAILALKQLNIQTELLSSDQKRQTERTATALHFDTFHAELQPQDQTKYVEMAKREGKIVAMVGENPEALSTADIAFGKIPLSHLVETIQLSKSAFQKISQNLLFAYSYHLILIPLAALGFIHPILAGAAMVLSTLLISQNTLRKKSVQIKKELIQLEHERSMD